MVFYKILIFFVVFSVFVDFTASFPTFGDEFVHIKVHVPHDPASSHGYLKPRESESEVSQLHHTGGHKVIHHYHRRRRPIKKVPKIEPEPVFENVLLAELDNLSSDGQTYQHEAKHKVPPPTDETYVVKEEHHDKPTAHKVNTYTVVEETLRKPNYNHYEETHQPHHEYGKNNIETFKIVEEHKPQKHYQPQHVQQHVETVKLIEEKPYYPQQQHVDTVKLIDEKPYYPQQQQHVETVKLIEEKPYYPQQQQQHVETVKLIEEKPYYPKQQQHTNKEEYINYRYHKPQNSNYETSYVSHQEAEEEEEEEKNYYPQSHIRQHDYELYKSQQRETLEIVKTIPTHTKGYGRPYQEEPYEIYHGKETLKTKTPIKYHYETENNYEYHQPQEDIVQIRETQYLKPKDEYYPDREIPEEEYHLKKQQQIKSHETGYNYHSPSLHQHSYETNNQHYIPSVPAERKPQFKASPSYTQYEERPRYAASSNIKSNKYSNDVQLQLPSTENPTDFYSSNNYPTLAPTGTVQNTLYDELGTSSVYRPGAAEETYTGYDSYSAAHVQGVGSGGYKFPIAYA